MELTILLMVPLIAAAIWNEKRTSEYNKFVEKSCPEATGFDKSLYCYLLIQPILIKNAKLKKLSCRYCSEVLAIVIVPSYIFALIFI